MKAPALTHIRDRPEAELSVRIVADGGRPVGAARVYVRDVSGAPVLPDGITYELERPFGREHHVVTPGSFEVTVPAGPTRIRVELGPEFLATEQTIDVEPARKTSIEVAMRRWISMSERGWYSADLHGHRHPDAMDALMRAESLDVATSIAVHNGRQQFGPHEGSPWLREMRGGAWCSAQDVEVERLEEGTGAFLALGAPLAACSADLSPVAAWMPAETELAASLRSAGAHLHAEKPFWRLTPLLVVEGLVDSLGVVGNHLGRDWAYDEVEPLGAAVPEGGIRDGSGLVAWLLELYDLFLDAGYAVPAAGGSASGWMPNPLGFARTYVRTGESVTARTGAGAAARPCARPDRGAFYGALERGHSFATNGPMVWLEVDGEGPGATVGGDRASAPHHVTARAAAAHHLDVLEMVRDGEVIAREAGVSDRDGTWAADLQFELPSGVGGWVAARAHGSELGVPRYATTSAVLLGGRPSVRRDAALERLAAWLGSTAVHLAAQRPAPLPLIDAYETARRKVLARAST